jgi:RNA ligase
MFYDFPHITHINDVLPHIDGREEFRVLEKDGYTVVNYAVAFEETFQWDSNDPIGSAVRRECRGITFDSNGNLICRKYQKFFNIGEKEETQLNKVNLYEPHIVLQKLDGSLIAPQPSSNGFVLTTKAGVTEISQQAEDFIKDKPHYSTFIKKCIQRGTTPLFEWCSNKNRIVISYETDQLILTGMRYNDTGKYVDYEIMKTYATAWNIPVVQAVNGLAVQDINLFVKQVREWDDEEGVVIRFNSGHMVKIKADDYVLRHKTKDSISQEKNVIATILDDSVDDLVPLLTPEDAERLIQFQNAFWTTLEDVASDLADLFVTGNTKYPDKKDFAVEFVQKIVLPKYAPVMYAMKSGKGSQEVLVEMIGKSLSSQTKIDQIRWMFGGLNWNHIDTKEP